MTALGTHPEPGARILDVACGNGALTFGLLASGLLTDSDVFCFDHSVESMRVFLNTASQLTTSNRLYASSQDVHRMAYPERFFDVVFGNAVLHHFLEYEVVLEQVRRILKPGATAIFAEPVGYGYLWAVFLMRLAAEQARRDIAQETQTGPVDRVLARVLRRETSTEHKSEGGADSSRLGLLDFIVDNTFYRLEHHDSKAALSSLTDKHYFLYDEVANLAARLGFQVRFASYEPPEYYGAFMRDMLTTYHVADPAVAEKAYALYAQLRESLPSSLHRVMSHFQFFILKKVGC